MLHAPASESHNKNRPGKSPNPPQPLPGSHPSTAHSNAGGAQPARGNQALLRIGNTGNQSGPLISPRPSQSLELQRKCACGGVLSPSGGCAGCKAKQETKVQRAVAAGTNPAVAPPIVHDVLRSSGQALDKGSRALMEPQFGQDFSGVRVHTDAKAAESARAVSARAYTVGRNVVFGAGEYQPGTSVGKRLMAHELAHVVQQGQGSHGVPSQLKIADAGHYTEREAADASDAVTKGHPTRATSGISPQVSRDSVPDTPKKQPDTVGAAANIANTVPVPGNPKDHPNYIQNVVKRVGIPVWGGAFWLYRKDVIASGLDPDSVVIPRAMVSLANDPASGLEMLSVYTSRAAADDAIKSFGVPDAYTYYVGPAGHIYPTVISDTTASSLTSTLRAMVDQEGKDAKVAATTTFLLGVWAAGIRAPVTTGPLSAATNDLITAQSQARILTGELQGLGKSATVNLGGAGEIADVINVNPLLDQTVKGIPRLIKGTAEGIAKIFSNGTVDRIISNNIVRGQVNWAETAKACMSVLKSGGTVSISPYIGDLAAHLAEIQAAFTAAGFKDVLVTTVVVVSAVKP